MQSSANRQNQAANRRNDKRHLLAANIVLIGLPGSGKTSAGRHLARLFSCPFVDSDVEIESVLGMSIRDYFELKGEAAFRNKETAALTTFIAKEKPFVLSTGGGSVLKQDNREILRNIGTVVYLYTDPETLFMRLKKDTKRPLLKVPDVRKKIKSLFDERDMLYRETAHVVVECIHSTPKNQAESIAEQLKNTGFI